MNSRGECCTVTCGIDSQVQQIYFTAVEKVWQKLGLISKNTPARLLWSLLLALRKKRVWWKREILQEKHLILWKLLKVNGCHCRVGKWPWEAERDGAGWARCSCPGLPNAATRGDGWFFHSVIFGSLRADPNSVALLAMKPCSHCRRTARETLASAPWDHVCSDANPRVRFALPAPVCQ